MITGENVRSHELVGLEAEAGGARGRVVDETMRTITLEGGGRRRTLPKAGRTWRFELPGGPADVPGAELAGRPHERLVRA